MITPVSLDHQHYLGDTLPAIAAEKAGILKPGVGAVVGPQPVDAGAVIVRRAQKLGCPLDRHGVDFDAEPTADGLRFRYRDTAVALPRPALLGDHQIVNATVALASLHGMGDGRITESHMAAGLESARWPARLQRLRRGPLVAACPEGWELWLDAGHNPAAAEVLGAFVQAWRDCPLHLVLGMLDTKDARGFLRPLASAVDVIVCVPVPESDASLGPERLAAFASEFVPEISTAPKVDEALAQFPPGPAARVLICGSTYLAGSVLRENG